jgi:bacterioferritin (cytochrome b1)
MDKAKVIELLNGCLGWEYRAQLLYAHYAEFVGGVSTGWLKEHFEEESAESIGHAQKVRAIIAHLDGIPTVTPDPTPIPHTLDAVEMLKNALKTERKAAQAYSEVMPLIKEDPIATHDIMHIYMDEVRSTEEVEQILRGSI